VNFEFSEDVLAMRDQAARLLADRLPRGAVLRCVQSHAGIDTALWRELGDLGWLGAALPEAYGGAGLGYEALCMLAEELGAVVAPVPFSVSCFVAAEAVLQFGSEAQKQLLLPSLAAGKSFGTFALGEGRGDPDPSLVQAAVADGRLSGCKIPVCHADAATFSIVVARAEDGEPALYVVDLAGPGIATTRLHSLDIVHPSFRVAFDHAPADMLRHGRGWAAVERLLDRAAVMTAFEQVGGARAALTMARDYALDRYAFGRPIGSFQAIKHKLADIYVAVELARSNAYFGAWALDHDAPELGLAAAACRVSASAAYELASRENIQTHGGMGFTWESECHLHYRRSKELALALGSNHYWRTVMLQRIARSQQNGAAHGFY
jgi:alkylation response protein AidB-like acyl-CoA dehydrogenase